MRWTSQASAGLLAVALVAGCNGQRGNQGTGAAGTSSETGSMSDTSRMSSDTTGMSRDTSGMSQMRADTGRTGMRSDTGSRMRSDSGARKSRSSSRTGTDSAKANQTKSGVTNTETGKSTLGPGVTKTRPDQGQPVTSKGDTVNAGVDSAR
jgi:hypothetical protein